MASSPCQTTQASRRGRMLASLSVLGPGKPAGGTQRTGTSNHDPYHAALVFIGVSDPSPSLHYTPLLTVPAIWVLFYMVTPAKFSRQADKRFSGSETAAQS
ncbi:hypothetical protein MES4922_30456 [Mesorhizobium ventifaucium]|uniref:Uncharacterized protein n=1 Tax=Mesorhizobium ventifaucium TaxID=666020 RepID=A0ABN8JWJ1_9HYPH|nr:hypothetical protein MES4922_30456 [Mesorhizobium ventifaucium]